MEVGARAGLGMEFCFNDPHALFQCRKVLVVNLGCNGRFQQRNVGLDNRHIFSEIANHLGMRAKGFVDFRKPLLHPLVQFIKATIQPAELLGDSGDLSLEIFAECADVALHILFDLRDCDRFIAQCRGSFFVPASVPLIHQPYPGNSRKLPPTYVHFSPVHGAEIDTSDSVRKLNRYPRSAIESP